MRDDRHFGVEIKLNPERSAALAPGWEWLSTLNVKDRDCGGARFDPFSAGFQQDPYPHYLDCRRQHSVIRGRSSGATEYDCWYVVDYDTAKEALNHPQLSVQRPLENATVRTAALPSEGALRFFEMLSNWMIFRDPPDHTRLRTAFNSSFSKVSLESLILDVGQIAQLLLAETPQGEPFDLIAQFALPLPVIVIGRMLGVPPEELANVKRWSSAMLSGLDVQRAADPSTSFAAAGDAVAEFTLLFSDMIDQRRRNPGDDLLGRALRNPHVSDDELIANCALLLFAGHETTVNAIGNGVLALLRHPYQFDLLRRDPMLMSSAVEELLRYDSPSQITFRYASAALQLRGVSIAAGEPVGIVIGSANRDENQFDLAQNLNLHRRPNRHLSFGSGTHTCLGSFLARIETRVAIEQLLAGFSNLELAGEVSWAKSLGIRGVSSLPLYATRFDQRAPQAASHQK